MPFQIGNRIKLKPGWRPAKWRPDANYESASRFAKVTKTDAEGFWFVPEHRVRPIKLRWELSVRFVLAKDIDPNVYADWIEENAKGEHAEGWREAAAALRQAFPME